MHLDFRGPLNGSLIRSHYSDNQSPTSDNMALFGIVVECCQGSMKCLSMVADLQGTVSQRTTSTTTQRPSATTSPPSMFLVVGKGLSIIDDWWSEYFGWPDSFHAARLRNGFSLFFFGGGAQRHKRDNFRSEKGTSLFYHKTGDN